MVYYCSVPVSREDGKILDEDGNYFTCGLKAKYKVGMWYVCEEHKRYYTDPNKWEAIPIDTEDEIIAKQSK